MSIIHRYISSQILKAFLTALIILLFIFTLGTAFKLLQKDISGMQFFRVLPFAVLYTLPYLLPVALLVATSLIYGRLVANNEVLAMRASGISPTHIMAPGWIAGLILSLLALPLEATLLPALHFQRQRLASAVIEQFIAHGSGQHKSIRLGTDDTSLYIRHFENGHVHGIVLRKLLENLDVKVVAREGKIEVNPERQTILLELDHVSVTSYQRNNQGLFQKQSRAHVKSFTHEIMITQSKPLSTKDLSSHELHKALEKFSDVRARFAITGMLLGASTHHQPDNRFRAALNVRAVTPCACFLFVFIGIPIALILSSENYLVPFFISFLAVSLFFFVPFTLGKSVAGRGEASILWLWLGPITGLIAGLLLTTIAIRR